VGRGMMLLAAEGILAGEGRDAGPARHPGGQDKLGRAEHQRLAVPFGVHRPLAVLLVVGRARGLGVRPVVKLHDLRVGLEPVGDLVLGGEDRPGVGKLEVGHVVVPDRVMQAQ
jgi:hypothetical protein